MEFLKYLEPKFDSAKSFYKKASIYKDNNGKLYLKSYETIVAEITDKIITEDNKTKVKVNGWYSMTTARHINEFLQQYGFQKLSKKEMEGGVC